MESISLITPITKENIERLKVGDMVLISGEIFTGRDRAHKYLYNEHPSKDSLPFKTEGGILYHCGPIVKTIENETKVIAAGPTTSARVDFYEPWVIEHYGIRGIIGKGGMSRNTLSALKEFGCVYFHAVSGAAGYLADRITNVKAVYMADEFGMAEAIWVLDVKDFPALVTMDAHGNSLHEEVQSVSRARFLELVGG